MVTTHKCYPSRKTNGCGAGGVHREKIQRDKAPLPGSAPSLLPIAADAGARFPELGQLAAPLRARRKGRGGRCQRSHLLVTNSALSRLHLVGHSATGSRCRNSPASRVESLPSFLAFTHCTARRVPLRSSRPRAGEHRYAHRRLALTFAERQPWRPRRTPFTAERRRADVTATY